MFLNPGENLWSLIVKFWSIFGVFGRISRDFRTPAANVCSRGRAKKLITPRKRARQKVLHSDARFCQVAGFPAMRWLWTWHWRTQSHDFGRFLDDFATFDDTIIHRALHHPPVVVWQIWFRQVVDDIDQVQDNITVMLRVLVSRFADDIDRDTERYLSTMSVLMWITCLMIRRAQMTEMLLHHAEKRTEMSDNHMTLNATLDEETPSGRSHNRVRNRRFPKSICQV